MNENLPAAGTYLLLLGATMALRERAIVASLRAFRGPLATIAPTAQTRAAKFFDYVLHGVPSDPQAALECVLRFEKERGLRPAGVVPFVDGHLVAGRAVADHYGLPYLSEEAVETSSINKNLMKDRLLAAGVPTPRYLRVDDLDAVHAAIADVGLPCVIKPSAFGGSLGVRLVTDAAQAAEAYAYVRRIIDETAGTFSVKNRSVQVEEFCTLPDEVSVEVLTHPERPVVLAVVDKALGPHPFFAEIGHRIPSRYGDREDVADLALRACTALGLDRGMAHVEMRLGDGLAPTIIEVGARTAGDGILDLVERTTGISGYGLHVLAYLDRLGEVPSPVAPSGVAAIGMLKARPGRITAVRTPQSVDPAVTSYEVSAVPGAVSAAGTANYLTREGYVECHWPGAAPGDVPATAHLDIAEALSEQLFAVEDVTSTP